MTVYSDRLFAHYVTQLEIEGRKVKSRFVDLLCRKMLMVCVVMVVLTNLTPFYLLLSICI